MNRKEAHATRGQEPHGAASMPSSNQLSLLELQTQLWKARAVTKQKWLERMLTEPAKSPRAAARRSLWIKRTLDTVRRVQADTRYRAALADAYTEHLSVLEMILMSAVEQRNDAENGGRTQRS